MSGIKLYGTDTCPMTSRARQHLESLGVGYEYFNIERDPAAREWVRAQHGGKEKKPTIQIGSRVMTEPTDDELDAALAGAGAVG